MRVDKTSSKILKVLLKDFLLNQTITSLAEETGISRPGIWKSLKKLEKEGLIILSQIGKGKTSIYKINLNWGSPLLEKTLNLALMEDTMKNQRWINDFKELENKVDFLIVYGSILTSPKEANDIDLLCITNKKKFIEIEEVIKKVQKTQLKKIHLLSFTQDEFKNELKKQNKAFIDAVKKGMVLFGHEKFIKFIKNIN